MSRRAAASGRASCHRDAVEPRQGLQDCRSAVLVHPKVHSEEQRLHGHTVRVRSGALGWRQTGIAGLCAHGPAVVDVETAFTAAHLARGIHGVASEE